MTKKHLPTHEEIVQYVTQNKEFLARLKEAASLTVETGKEVSLSLDVDVVKYRKYLSGIGIGTEDNAADVPRSHSYADNEYVMAMILHSHPNFKEFGYITPSLVDLLTVNTRWEWNVRSLLPFVNIKSAWDALYWSRNLKWFHQEAIIGVERDLSLNLLLYEASGAPFGENRKEVETQEDVVLNLRSLGFKARFFNYTLNSFGKYTAVEKYRKGETALTPNPFFQP